MNKQMIDREAMSGAPLRRGARGLEQRLIRAVRPAITIWFHQHLRVVDVSGVAAIGNAVLAIRSLKNPATPAAAPIGPRATGTHIILLPKLALSCSKKISAAVTSAPAAVRAERLRSKCPVRTLRTIRSMPWTGAPAPGRLVSVFTVSSAG